MGVPETLGGDENLLRVGGKHLACKRCSRTSTI